jgi:hypothetical protein
VKKQDEKHILPKNSDAGFIRGVVVPVRRRGRLGLHHRCHERRHNIQPVDIAD